MKTNKVNRDLLKEYISFIPSDYKFESETAKKVFAVIYHYSKLNNNNSFTLGQETIAFETGLSTKQIGRTVKVLTRDYKYINYQRGYTNSNSTYTVLTPSENIISNQMSSLNVPTEMSSLNVPTQNIEDEEVNPQMSALKTSGDIYTKCPINNNNNYNNNINTNIVEISNIDRLNKSKDNKEKVKKEMATQIEEKLLERIEVMENNQEKMATLLERLMEKTILPTSTFEEKKNEEVEGLKAKLSQLEETTKKQAEEITHLNERLDKAGKAFLELRNSINSTSTQVEEKKTYTTKPTYSTNIENSYSKEKGEYVEAIKAFYDFKRDNNLEECRKMLETLQKLAQTGKLTEYQVQKIEKCEEILGEWGKANNQRCESNFSTYQSKFYDILKKENFSEEDFKELTKVVKKIEILPNLPKENFNKIVEIYANTMAKDPERKKAYFTEYYAYRNVFRYMLGKGEDEELIYQLCQKYSDYLLTLRQVPREILRKAGMEEVLLFSKGCWSDEAIRWKLNYEQKASLSLQNVEGGTTDHTEEENVSEGLKTTKNEVLTDINTTEISETKVEEPETTKEEVKTEVVENSPVSLENVESGTTDHADQETLSESLKSGKNKELTSVNSAYNPPIRIEEGRSTLFVPLNSNVSEDDLVAKMLGN